MQELYNEIIANEDLKAAFVEAAEGGKTLEFLREKGCEATEEEMKAFLTVQNGELSDEELDNADGGTCNGATAAEALVSVISAGIACATAAFGSMLDQSIGQIKEDDGRLCNKK